MKDKWDQQLEQHIINIREVKRMINKFEKFIEDLKEITRTTAKINIDKKEDIEYWPILCHDNTNPGAISTFSQQYFRGRKYKQFQIYSPTNCVRVIQTGHKKFCRIIIVVKMSMLRRNVYVYSHSLVLNHVLKTFYEHEQTCHWKRHAYYFWDEAQANQIVATISTNQSTLCVFVLLL